MDAEAAREPRPVACSLSAPELAARRAGVLRRVAADRAEARWLPDGLALRFASDPGRVAALGEFIELERQCCAFLRFQLTVEAGGRAVWLELTGPVGTREFLSA
jgi:hypothetical protein